MHMYILLERTRKKYEKINSGFLFSNLKFYIHIKNVYPIFYRFNSYYLLH